MRKVNLGCATYKLQDYINIDINPKVEPDIVRDVRRGLPFDDSSVDEVYTSHFLEHLDPDNFLFLVGEIYRVLIPSGLWTILVPLGVTGDLDHKMIFTRDSFDVLTREETANYFNIPMRWRYGIASQLITDDSPRHLDMLSVVLQAVKR
jgi:predicted SAM-dependent methyltransferase